MRTNLIRALAVAAAVGPLAACIPGGEPPDAEPDLLVFPDPIVIDLPDDGSGERVQKTVTVVNVGQAETKPLFFDVEVVDPQPGMLVSVEADRCEMERLSPLEACTGWVALEGVAAEDDTVFMLLRVLEDDGTVLATVDVRLV